VRVLVANERVERLETLATVLAGLGHEVVIRHGAVEGTGALTGSEKPDIALLGLGGHGRREFESIAEIVHEASCPAIVLLRSRDPALVREAANRGVFAYVVDDSADELQSAIEITLQRSSEYRSLQGAFDRRAVIEQAKGILMERHSVDAEHAFGLLREDSRRARRKLVAVAQTIVDSHLLLSAARVSGPTGRFRVGHPSGRS
jgi:response regulator NasT